MFVPLKVGESFVHMSQNEATARMEEMKAKLDADVQKLDEEKRRVTDEMAKLKTALYAKFGDTINLDNSEKES